jgi:DNA (cytosine-5)-methyltransferase 1
MLNTISFFSGVGGIDLAFKENGFNIIWANEIDKKASITYKENFSSKLQVSDIHEIIPEELPDFSVLIAGFPCQAFSIAGYRKGFSDDRGNLFFELLRIIKVKQPKVVFLENVKNLISHDNGNTYRVIYEALKSENYFIKQQVLNATEYGNLPQNRERIYIVAFKEKEAYKNFQFPEPIPLTNKLSKFIDYTSTKEKNYSFYTSENCKFYDELNNSITKKTTVYQWRRVYVRENKSNVCPTLTANMGTGGHNVPLILSQKGIRKLTPKECFALQGYPTNYKLPKDMANCHLYKQSGNSVVVPVISRIAFEIKKAINF